MRVLDVVSRILVFERVQDIGIVYSIEFSPDGRYLAVGRYGVAVIWNTTNWTIVDRSETRHPATRLLFHPNRKAIILGCGYEALIWKFIDNASTVARILTYTCTSKITGFAF